VADNAKELQLPMKKNLIFVGLLIVALALAGNLIWGEKYKCAHCQKRFSTLPYQELMYMMKQPISYDHVSDEVPTYCSCACGLEAKKKLGYDYICH